MVGFYGNPTTKLGLKMSNMTLTFQASHFLSIEAETSIIFVYSCQLKVTESFCSS